jgi:hypothetical protein
MISWNISGKYIRLVNGKLGLHVPTLITPLELLGEE